MTEIRIDAAKAERIITHILHDKGLPAADANEVAANICRRLTLTTRTNSPLISYRIIPREPPYGGDFATVVAKKLTEAKSGPWMASELWQLVYAQGRDLRAN